MAGINPAMTIHLSSVEWCQAYRAVTAAMPLKASAARIKQSGVPSVDFLFVHLLESGALQVPVGVLNHVKCLGHLRRATLLLGALDPLRDQCLLRAALAVALG